MGRWLARLQQEEKNVNSPGSQTLKTFETPSDEVLKVLKVPHPGKSENFLPDDIEREERLAVYGEPKPSSRSVCPSMTDADANLPTSPRPVATDDFQARPADWMPEPSPGVRILRPAVEMPATEYDKHLDKLIAVLPAGSVEAQRLAFAKRKGWVVECQGRRIYTRGRF